MKGSHVVAFGIASTLITSLATSIATIPTLAVHSPCLCVFDVDRTLTGKQRTSAECPSDLDKPDIFDGGYGGGPLLVADAALKLSETFCGQYCHIGIVSAGVMAGAHSSERSYYSELLSEQVNNRDGIKNFTWQDGCPEQLGSPLVLKCPDGQKQKTVTKIVQWYAKVFGINIADKDVHFFDDRESNVAPFKNTNYNAHQISCTTRDCTNHLGATGLCGATIHEIIEKPGVTLCNPEDNPCRHKAVVV